MRIFNKRAVSIIEFSLLFIIVIGAFLIMKGYIQRGIYGKWGQAGKSMAFGRQYDPQKTIECSFDEQSNQWYDRNCYNYYTAVYCADGSTCSNLKCTDGSTCGCNGDLNCQESIISASCKASSCTQLNNGATP